MWPPKRCLLKLSTELMRGIEKAKLERSRRKAGSYLRDVEEARKRRPE
jgi:hypothetical protein